VASRELAVHAATTGSALRAGVGALLLLWAMTVSSAQAANYVVTSANNTGGGTLRQAITNANGNAGADTITFAIAGAGVHTINLNSALPTITETVTIDGYTQGGGGYTGPPLIEVNGTGAGAVHGLTISGAASNNSAIRGLIINRFQNAAAGTAIRILNSSNNVITGNYLGTNAAGAAASANRVGIFIQGTLALPASGNQIGGLAAGDRNIVSGNMVDGIQVNGTGANNNSFRGNHIGVDVSGTVDLGNAAQGIIINGGAANNTVGGLVAAASNVISGNGNDGVAIADAGTTGNLVQGNRIGTNAAGTAAVPNLRGIEISNGATGNTVGGPLGSQNLISGNTGQGVSINGAGTSNNVVSRALIGTNAAGNAPIPNGSHGVEIVNGATNNTIGGVSGTGNVISGNAVNGVNVIGAGTSGNGILGNIVGLDLAGAAALGNSQAGVAVGLGATANVVGNATGGNVISGNGTAGVRIVDNGTSNNLIQSNLIGLDAAGTLARPNVGEGVILDCPAAATGNRIGGVGFTNVISGNGSVGIRITNGMTGTLVVANVIGRDPANSVAIPNGSGGVRIQASSGNTIGGVGANEGNVIAGNSGSDGVAVVGATATGNAILGNSIFSNAGLGIDLGDDGLTWNDAGDVDAGPNNLQNFPVLSAAMTNSLGTVANFAGSLSGPAIVATYRVEFFASAAADPTGFGEGQRYLGFTNVTTNAAGNAIIGVTLATGLTAGEYVTATATDPANNTSEFSGALVAVGHLVVTTTSDLTTGSNTGSVSLLIANPGTDGRISLREAILAANNTAGADTITFGIPLTDANHYYYRDNAGAGFAAEVTTALADVATASSPAITDFDANYPTGLARSWYRIQPGSGYAAITGPTVLDASTQPGYIPGGPVIELVGSSAGNTAAFGVNPGAASTIRGFVINMYQREGIHADATAIVQGNHIGTDVSGTIARGNGTIFNGADIAVTGDNTQIGGLTLADRNIISAGSDWGVFVNAQSVVVQGNYIGTDVTGTVAFPNARGGIDLYGGSGHTIGGPLPGARNVISGNTRYGIEVKEPTSPTANNNTIQGNYIGTSAAGTAALPNTQHGIFITNGSTGNTVLLNTIAYNGSVGVAVQDPATVGNAIVANSIFANGGLGIDLNVDGVTANDAGDADAGPNNLQNFPVLTSAVTNGAGAALFTGSLNSAASTTYRLEFFASAAADPTGYGEGQRHLGFTNVTTDVTGNAAISVSLPATLAAGERVTSTATNPANSTSEFSANAVATLANITTVGTGCTGGTVPTGPNFVVHGAFDGGATPALNNFTTSVWSGANCPGDTGETIKTTGFCGGTLDLITQFPGDPGFGIPGASNSLYANGNDTYPVGGPPPYQPYLVWRQTVTGLQPNKTYTFFLYGSNANNPPAAPTYHPTLRLCKGVTGGPPYACATQLNAADFVIQNETVATGDVWGRYQVTFTTGAGETTADLAVLDAATDTNGDNLQITQLGVQACGAATAVKLMSFTAVARDRAVDLLWQTGSELGNLGFHLYRSPSSSGPWTRMTPSLIPGLGSSPVGAMYSWPDTGLTNGTRYYYRLEDVDTASVSTFHGPVSAVPQPAAGGGGEGGEGGGAGGEGGSPTPCPSWVLAADGAADSTSVTCTKHGDPDSASFEVLSRDSRQAVVELRTRGFWAVQEAVIPKDSAGTGPAGSAGVRVYVRGLDTPLESKALALPLRRALVEAVVGKQVRLVSAEALDLKSFPGLRPSAVGLMEMGVSRDGSVRAVRRSLDGPRVSRGYSPQQVARLAGTVFQGEQKSAVVELVPVRYDGVRGQLVLAGRVRVRLAFTGVAPGETGSGGLGRLQRRQPHLDQDVLAQLHTIRRGLHGVRFEELFPGRQRPMETSFLRLQRQGEAVSYHVEPASGTFGPGSVLYFHADRTAASTDFTSEVSYELVRSREGDEMGMVLANPEGPALVTPSTGQALFETNRFYQSGLLEAPDVWLWEGLLSGASRTKAFSLAGVDTGSVESGRLLVYLQGASESGTVVDHHVGVSVNGTFAGEARFSGKRPYRMELAVPASVLREGGNEITVVNAGDTGVSSLVFLDRFSVAYPQRPEAHAGAFEGAWSEDGTAEVVGLNGPAVVLDVTEAAAVGTAGDVVGTSSVKWLTGAEALVGSVRFRAESGHRYLVASGEGVLAPRVVRPEPSTLRSAENQADYLLVAPESFLGAAEPLLARRASQGLTVKAVSLEEIATVFGHGRPSGEAIRGFVSHAYHSWAKPSPRYVVLLGDATSDPQHFLSTSSASPLPAFWGKTSFLWTAMDPQIGAVNGDDALPDLAVGRIPATTLEQAESLVAKILAWEDSGPGLEGRVAFVVDNPDEAGDFEADVADIQASFLGDRETTVLKVGELGAATRPAIQEAFDSGLSLLSYVGHGGSAVWASENVWNSWDAPSLLAQSRQPLLLTMNCLNGYFVAPNFESLSESLLKAEGRGAVAAFSPSGLSVDGPAHQYHRAVVKELISGKHERLGDAILAAQTTYAETGLMPELLSVYHLLGDPAMKIR
jgi:hypothetical protein